MANVELVLNAERWLDEVLLFGTVTDGGGADLSDRLRLPPGIGDVALMEMTVLFGSIATAVNLENLAMRANVISTASGADVDIIGKADLKTTGATRAVAHFSPDPLVLWRQGEEIGVTGPEVDSNAAPTADVFYYVKCVRVRPHHHPTPGPIRLVR